MAFGNSILAGTKLVRESIQSPNYVADTAGWTVNRDGTAEFDDVLVRGRIESRDPDFPTRISYLDIGQVGISYNLGEPDAATMVLTESLLQFAGANGTLRLSDFDNIGALLGYENQHGVIIQSSDTRGFLRWNESALLPNAEEWTNATLQNGWTNVAGFAAAGYYMRPDGFVALRGVCAAGTTADDTLLFTLPTGYRPTAEALVAVGYYNGVGYQLGYLRIETDGQVRVYGAGGAANIRMDGLQFPTV